MLLKNSSYIRFLNYLNATEISGLKNFDAIEGQLLDYLMLAHSNGRDLLVGDLIQLSQFGSQATLHGRVKSLVAMGYLKLVEDKEDGRRKRVTPTAKSYKRYEKLSVFLKKASIGG